MISHNSPLARYTSWRVGGNAKQLYRPESLAALQHYLSEHPEDSEMLWLGLGSNTLVRDGGFNGTVIVLQGGLGEFEQKDSRLIRAEAGLPCATLSRKTARLGLSGLEFMAGIPGTVGGALRMNAGCWGGETWPYVQAVETLDAKGCLHYRKADEFKVGYRSVEGLDEAEWFVAAWFELESGDKDRSFEMIRTLLDERAKRQPTGEYNCGSVFRNPPGDYAARLIESCGLKGKVIGDAEVSLKHANFITNRGQASAKDIESLIEHVREVVIEETGIALIREVHIVGEI